MATLELSTLLDHFDQDEIDAVKAAIQEVSSASFDVAEEGESVVLERDIDSDIFVDFQDRLEANDASADIYLPVDFEDVIEVGEHRFGSSHALLIVLENIKEDFFVEDEEEDEEVGDDEDEYGFDEDETDGFHADDESPIEMKDEQLRHIWRAMYKGAQSAVRKSLCLYVRE